MAKTVRKINVKKINFTTLDANNNYLEASLSLGQLKKLKISSITCDKLLKLRLLLRMRDNFRRAADLFIEVIKIFEDDYQKRLMIESRLTEACILYGACFLESSKGKRPSEALSINVNDNKFHKSLMRYRNKLYCHIDNNNEHRSDEINWVFEVGNNILIPRRHFLGGNRTLMPDPGLINSWKDLTHEIIQSIFHDTTVLTQQINEEIGEIIF